MLNVPPNKLPAVALHEVIVSRYNKYIHGPWVGSIVQLESMEESFQGCTRDSDIVDMSGIPLILCGGWCWRGEKVMQGRV